MNFLNPYIEIYLKYPNVNQDQLMPFYREVLWLFSKNLSNSLRMIQHRVNIDIRPQNEETKNFRFGSIYSYNTNIDIEGFKQLDELSQRKRILELVYQGFMSLAGEYNWDTSVILKAYNLSLEDDCQFEYKTELKNSPCKKFKGCIRINLEGILTTFTVELRNIKSNELVTTQILQMEQSYFAWQRSVREFGWMDSDNFGIKLLKGEIWLTANTKTAKRSETYKPKKHQINFLKGFVNQMQESSKYFKHSDS